MREYEEIKYKFKEKCTAYTNFTEYKDLLYPIVVSMEIIDVKN